jgi:hypothetical protein
MAAIAHSAEVSVTPIPTDWANLTDLIQSQQAVAPVASPAAMLQASPIQPSLAPARPTRPAAPVTPRLSIPQGRRFARGGNPLHLQAQVAPLSAPAVTDPLIQAAPETPFTTITATTTDAALDTQTLERLAQEIYQLLRQRLAVEQERHGRVYTKRFS